MNFEIALEIYTISQIYDFTSLPQIAILLCIISSLQNRSNYENFLDEWECEIPISNWKTCLCQAYALLYDSVNKEDLTIRIGAIMGLGLAYAGSQKEEVRNS